MLVVAVVLCDSTVYLLIFIYVILGMGFYFIIIF